MNLRKNRNKNAKQRIMFLLVSVSIFLFSLFISLAPLFDLPFNVPTWAELLENLDNESITLGDEEGLNVYFIDVGQGDCILIHYLELAILIDAGERVNADRILSFLQKLKIKDIDCLIATHPHSDHIGAIPEIVSGIEVKKIILPYIDEKAVPTTKLFEEFLIAIEAADAEIAVAIPGDQYSYLDLTLTILAPLTDNDSLNNLSVVTRLDFLDVSFLFMGDAEKPVEKQLISINSTLSADVIKLGHHGSSSSSSKDFLTAVSPKLAIITCGKDNAYKHPSEVVKQLLNELNISYMRTDLNGTITVATDGTDINVFTER